METKQVRCGLGAGMGIEVKVAAAAQRFPEREISNLECGMSSCPRASLPSPLYISPRLQDILDAFLRLWDLRSDRRNAKKLICVPWEFRAHRARTARAAAAVA